MPGAASGINRIWPDLDISNGQMFYMTMQPAASICGISAAMKQAARSSKSLEEGLANDG
jgi:hypothetical protein